MTSVPRSGRREGRGIAAFLLVTTLLLGMLAPVPAPALEIVIVVQDNPGEGFNDPTPFNPVGGNPATTLGEARLNAVQYAANILGQYLRGTVPVVVNANFDKFVGPDAPIWSAGEVGVQGIYVDALANNLNGADGSPGADAALTVNGNLNWYLGLDGNVGPNQHDLVSGAISMLMSGLGFGTNADVETGALSGDSYTALLAYYNLSNNTDMPGGLTLLSLLPSDTERATAFASPGELVFTGPITAAAIAAGKIDRNTSTEGFAPIYAPSTVEKGRTGSYFDTKIAPLQAHRPFYTAGAPAVHHPGLGLYVLADIGWNNVADAMAVTGIREGTGSADLTVAVLPQSGSVTVSQGNLVNYVVTITNDGPNTAVGTSLTAFLPKGSTPGAPIPSQGVCTATGSIVSCQVDDIAAGTSVLVQIPATLGAGISTPGGTRVHTLTVRTSSTTSDPDTGNNQGASTLASDGVTLEDLKSGGGCSIGSNRTGRPDPVLPLLVLAAGWRLWKCRRAT